MIMKWIVGISLFLCGDLFAQVENNSLYIKTIADVWTKIKLFHAVEREPADLDSLLIEVIKQLPNIHSQNDLCNALNRHLLFPLKDNLAFSIYGSLQETTKHDISEPQLISAGNWYWDFRSTDLGGDSTLHFVNNSLGLINNDTLLLDFRFEREVGYKTIALLTLFVKKANQVGEHILFEHEGWGEGQPYGYNYSKRWRLGSGGYPIRQVRQMAFARYYPKYKEKTKSSVSKLKILVNAYSESYLGNYLDAMQYSDRIEVIRDLTIPEFPSSICDKYMDSVFIQFNSNSFLSFSGSLGLYPDYEVKSNNSSENISKIIRRLSNKKERKAFTGKTGVSQMFSSLDTAKINPSKAERIAIFIKLHSILERFYPFSEANPIDWNAHFNRFLEKVNNSSNVESFYSVLSEYVKPLNDSHVQIYFHAILATMTHTLPIKIEKVQGKAIITDINSDSLLDSSITIGSEILRINDMPIDSFENFWDKRISHSTPRAGFRDMYSYYGPLSGPINSNVRLRLKNFGSSTSHDVVLVRSVPGTYWAKPVNTVIFSRPQPDILYVNMSNLRSEWILIDSLKQINNNLKGIILDLRRRPACGYGFVPPFLADSSKYIESEEIPIISETSSKSHFLKKVSWTEGNALFNKPLVVLINENAQSGTESAIKSFRDRALFVGSQTAGTTGAITYIFFNGVGYAQFTGCKIVNPDGSLFFKNGVIPDVLCEPTIAGIRLGKDEVLDRAVGILKDMKK